MLHTDHPVQVHIVPMRRCNLACAYCNEFDDVSAPVPLAEMERRIDHLTGLGTSLITISGGEPLLHPDLDAIIARIPNAQVAGPLARYAYVFTSTCKAAERDAIAELGRPIRRVGDIGEEHRCEHPVALDGGAGALPGADGHAAPTAGHRELDAVGGGGEGGQGAGAAELTLAAGGAVHEEHVPRVPEDVHHDN